MFTKAIAVRSRSIFFTFTPEQIGKIIKKDLDFEIYLIESTVRQIETNTIPTPQDDHSMAVVCSLSETEVKRIFDEDDTEFEDHFIEILRQQVENTLNLVSSSDDRYQGILDNSDTQTTGAKT